MKYLNEVEYIEKIKKINSDYWNNSYKSRWEYMSVVIDELKIIDPKNILELGSYQINLSSDSDNMDRNIKYVDIDNLNNTTYIQQAQELPWDISDKKYDIFVALQVFEHLENTQSKVFDEIIRISKYAILSFPYKWKCEDINNCHHNIDEKIISKWTNNKIPLKIIKIKNRIIYIFKF